MNFNAQAAARKAHYPFYNIMYALPDIHVAATRGIGVRILPIECYERHLRYLTTCTEFDGRVSPVVARYAIVRCTYRSAIRISARISHMYIQYSQNKPPAIAIE